MACGIKTHFHPNNYQKSELSNRGNKSLHNQKPLLP